MTIVCTSCGNDISPGSGFYSDEGRRLYCADCWQRRQSEPPPPTHAEQVNQRVVNTATALREAGEEYRATTNALALAQKAYDDAGRRWEHLCRQMAEAATSWAILHEQGGREGAVPIGPAGVVDRGKGLE